jgi:hypothetical protein
MEIPSGIDANTIDSNVPKGEYLILRNGIYSVRLERMVGRMRIVKGIARDFGRVDFGRNRTYNIGKLIAAAYNDVPYSTRSAVEARDGDFTNICPKNVIVKGNAGCIPIKDLKGVDAHTIDPNIPEGNYTILRGGVYSHKTERMIGKLRIVKGLIVNFGMVEMGRGNTFNVGPLIAAAYNGIPYQKYNIAAARDGNYTNICPENIVIITRSTYGGKTFGPYQKLNMKVSDEDVKVIRESTETNTALGKKYGVSEMQISRIRRFIDRTKV